MPDPSRCLKAPTVAAPSFPFPFTAKLPKVSITFDPKLCCKLPPLPAPIPPIAIPAIVLSPALTVLKQAAAAISAVLDQIQISCPRE